MNKFLYLLLVAQFELSRQWCISGEREMIVAGMDFLKSFNLRIYPTKHRIDLIPIAHISLQEDQSQQKDGTEFRFRAFKNREGHAVVDFVKKGAFWQDFGVKEGDVVLNVNGHRLFDLPRSYFNEAMPEANHLFTIIRNRDTLLIQTEVPSTCEVSAKDKKRGVISNKK